MKLTPANAWTDWLAVRNATLDARERTGDSRVSVAVQSGRFAVQLVERRDNAPIIPLADHLTRAMVIDFLGKLTRAHIGAAMGPATEHDDELCPFCHDPACNDDCGLEPA